MAAALRKLSVTSLGYSSAPASALQGETREPVALSASAAWALARGRSRLARGAAASPSAAAASSPSSYYSLGAADAPPRGGGGALWIACVPYWDRCYGRSKDDVRMALLQPCLDSCAVFRVGL